MALVRYFGYLFALPFLLLYLLARLILALAVVAAGVVVLPIRLLWVSAVGSGKVAAKAGRWGAGTAAPWAAERSRPLVIACRTSLATALGRGRRSAAFIGGWIASARHDILDDTDREVNPVGLTMKLSAGVLLAGAAIIVLIKAYSVVLAVATIVAVATTVVYLLPAQRPAQNETAVLPLARPAARNQAGDLPSGSR